MNSFGLAPTNPLASLGNGLGTLSPLGASFSAMSPAVSRCCGGPQAGGGVDAMMQVVGQEQQMLMMLVEVLLAVLMGRSLGQPGGSRGGAGVPGAGSTHPAGSSGTSPGTGTGSAPSASTHDQGAIKRYIAQAAHAYGADPKVLTEIARRESNFQPGAVNNWDSNAKKGTPSKGMFQFIEPTFKSYAAQARKANPKAWEGLGPLNWMDWRQQALATAWAMKHGHGSAWATYAAAGGH